MTLLQEVAKIYEYPVPHVQMQFQEVEQIKESRAFVELVESVWLYKQIDIPC